MNAWLITWEGTQIYKCNLDKIAAVLSSRKSKNTVIEFVELLYLRSTCNAFDMARCANRRKDMPFRAHEIHSTKGTLYPGRLFCGSSDFMLYARQVTNLKIRVDKEQGKEILTWVEPPTYRLKDEQGHEIELASEGEAGYCERDYLNPLSRDTC